VLEKLKDIGGLTKGAIAKTATLVGDLNGDGKVDEEDARIAAEWAKTQAASVTEVATDLSKAAVKSSLAKDAAAGAAVGAVIAVPVPFIGPVLGAVVGGALGAYKNLKSNTPITSPSTDSKSSDIYGELLKLNDLKEKGILTEEEFLREKTRILK